MRLVREGQGGVLGKLMLSAEQYQLAISTVCFHVNSVALVAHRQGNHVLVLVSLHRFSLCRLQR